MDARISVTDEAEVNTSTFTKIDTWIGREQNNYKVNCYKTSSLIFVTPPWTASLLSEIDFKEGDYLKKKRLLL